MGKKGFILPLLLLLVALSSCMISLPAARAQLDGTSLPTTEDIMEAIVIFLFGSEALAQNPSWVTYEGFMQNLIFPFIALFTVMYGILTEIRIFHNANVKAVLSLVMAFVGGIWAIPAMHFFLLTNAAWGTVVWGVVLFIGICAWGWSRLAEYWDWGSNTRNRSTRRTETIAEIKRLSEKAVDDESKLATATGRDEINARLAIWKKTVEMMEEEKKKLKN